MRESDSTMDVNAQQCEWKCKCNAMEIILFDCHSFMRFWFISGRGEEGTHASKQASKSMVLCFGSVQIYVWMKGMCFCFWMDKGYVQMECVVLQRWRRLMDCTCN